LTQGRTRKEALDMIADWLETMIDRQDFVATVYPRGPRDFEIAGSDAACFQTSTLPQHGITEKRDLRGRRGLPFAPRESGTDTSESWTMSLRVMAIDRSSSVPHARAINECSMRGSRIGRQERALRPMAAANRMLILTSRLL
jgi:hypothetical protein